MSVEPSSARSLLDALRYLWRGTRWRKGQGRELPAEVGGYLFEQDGTQRTIGQLSVSIAEAVIRADLDDRELLILSDYYGLNGFPSGLSTGRDALVGGVATGATPTRRAASRTAVTKQLDEAVRKVATTLTPMATEVPLALVPEPDPIDRPWLWEPPVLAKRLTTSERFAVLEAGFYAAFDLIARAEAFPAVSSALHRWGLHRLHLGAPNLAEGGTEFEHRHSAFAALAITYWAIVNDAAQVDRALQGTPVIGWISQSRRSSGARYVHHPTRGSITSPIDELDFYYLMDDINERRDVDGRMADLVVDEILAGRHRSYIDTGLAVQLVTRGLAATGSWRAIELARWYAHSEPPSYSTFRVVTWAAHVASLHSFDLLAWRLLGLAERLIAYLDERGESEARVVAMGWQAALIRSGCRVRESERLLQQGDTERAAAGIADARVHLARARATAKLRADVNSLNKSVTNDLREAEIVLIEIRLHEAAQAIPMVSASKDRAALLLDRIARVLSHQPVELRFDAIEIFTERVNGLSDRLRALTTTTGDDSPREA